jgi:ADP-ribose pyrophosphatase
METAPAVKASPVVGPRQTVYENRYQRVCSVKVDFGSHEKEIFVNEHGSRVGLLFIRGAEVLLVGQYRLLPAALAWEIPGGRIDEGETPEQGAIREGKEETNLRAQQLHPLVFFIPGLDTCDNPTHVFWCDDFVADASAEHGDPHEIDGLRWMPFETCLDMVFEGKIMDSMTITALLAWQAVRNRVSPQPLP